MDAQNNEIRIGAAELQPNAPGSRELLSRVILSTLASWPDCQQRVFVQSHYQGQGTREIAASLALTPDEVSRILDECAQKLGSALRQFRSGEGHCPGTGSARRTFPARIG
jgi:DNA-directed RNA polymerase specialized sigma24 family protein